MSVYNTAEDIKPMSREEFKISFQWVTGKAFVENGNNTCENLFLSCHQKDLRYWQYVVQNRELARTVRRIVYDGSTLPREFGEIRILRRLVEPHLDRRCPLRDRDIKTFKAEMDRVDLWHSKHPEPAAREHFVAGKHEWVRAQVDAHLDIREKELDKELLSQALSEGLLPNLTGVVLTSLPREDCDIERREEAFLPPSRSPNALEWRCHFHDGPMPLYLICPRLSWSWPNHTGAHGPLGEMEQTLPGRETQCFHVAPVCAPFRELCILLAAFQASPKRLSEFSWLPSSDDSTVFFAPKQAHYVAGFPMNLFLPPLANMFQPIIKALGAIFENLQVLRLTIDCYGVGEGDSCGQFFRLLLQAKRLRVLHLKLESWNSWDDEQVLDFISCSSTLEEIELDGVEFTRDGFLQFLRRHRRLRGLMLHGCLFNDANHMLWKALILEANARGYLQDVELDIKNAMRRDGFEYMELPKVNRRDGIARRRRWHADPTSQDCPIECLE